MTDWERFRAGLEILSFYIPKHKQYLAADLDIIFVAEDSSRISPMHPDDAEKLQEFGFWLNADSTSWAYHS